MIVYSLNNTPIMDYVLYSNHSNPETAMVIKLKACFLCLLNNYYTNY